MCDLAFVILGDWAVWMDANGDGFSNAQERANQLEERLIEFAVRIIKLSARLPGSPAGKHLAGQIMRSEHRLHRITVRLGVRRVIPILFTSWESF